MYGERGNGDGRKTRMDRGMGRMVGSRGSISGFRIDPMEKLLERKIGESFEGVFLLINI